MSAPDRILWLLGLATVLSVAGITLAVVCLAVGDWLRRRRGPGRIEKYANDWETHRG